MSTTAVLVGSTGLVGSNILQTLTSHPSFPLIYAYTRRQLPTTSPKLTPLESKETTAWPSLFPTPPDPSKSILFSALGTTRAQAGSLAGQRAIDLDLNVAIAKAAREKGVETYILISSGGLTLASIIPYAKLKLEIEEEVKKMGFKHVVILRPGLLVGQRQDFRAAEWVMRKLATATGMVSNALKDGWAQDADVIARAAVQAGLECVEGKRGDGVWMVGQADIVRMGRTDWKEPVKKESL